MSTTSGTALDTGEELGAIATIRRGVHFSPELKDGIGGTLVLAVLASIGQVVVPVAVQQTLDHGLNGPGGPDVGVRRADGRRGGGRDRADRLGVVPDDHAAVHHLRARPGHAADQGVPARARPAAAHPEHRAARRPGLAGDQRRRPGQPVPGLRRPAVRRQRRADAGRDRRDGVLQLAARDRGLGLLRAAVPVAALLPAPALRGLRRRAQPGRRACCPRSPSRSSAPRSCGPTPSRTAPRRASTTRSTSTRRPAPAPRASPRSRSPSAASRPAWPTPACSSSASGSASPATSPPARCWRSRSWSRCSSARCRWAPRSSPTPRTRSPAGAG